MLGGSASTQGDANAANFSYRGTGFITGKGLASPVAI
jgi:hypothetical protein